jgi:hypothetical protein
MRLIANLEGDERKPPVDRLQELASRMGAPITAPEAKDLAERGVDGCGTLLPGFPVDEFFDVLIDHTAPAALRALRPAKTLLPPVPTAPSPSSLSRRPSIRERSSSITA